MELGTGYRISGDAGGVSSLPFMPCHWKYSPCASVKNGEISSEKELLLHLLVPETWPDSSSFIVIHVLITNPRMNIMINENLMSIEHWSYTLYLIIQELLSDLGIAKRSLLEIVDTILY